MKEKDHRILLSLSISTRHAPKVSFCVDSENMDNYLREKEHGGLSNRDILVNQLSALATLCQNEQWPFEPESRRKP